MIILRSSSRRKRANELYFVSTLSDLDGEFIKPIIPNNFLKREKVGDYKTARVCFYTSIDQALIAMDQNLTGKELYIYQPRNIDLDSLYKPSIDEAPYTILLDEYWYLDKVEVKYLTSIKVENKKKELVYHYGPRSAKRTLYSWNWKENLKPWEKKGKLFSEEDTITFYHVTKKENVPSILREGLKRSKAIEDINSASIRTGLPKELIKNKIYLSRNLNNLVMRPNDKRVILKVEVPMSVYNSWRDLGDPIRSYFKNYKEYGNHYLKQVEKKNPEVYNKISINLSEFWKRIRNAWNNMSPENEIVIDKDIPAKYISVL